MSQAGDDDVALKLLHTADWHLGMRFPSFSEEDQRTLMRARMEVLDRVLGMAQRHQVDAVVCAGDLFDEPRPAQDWWQGLSDRLQAHDWSNRPVFLLPGNHDPLTSNSVWHETHPFRTSLPPGVHVVDRDDFTHPLGDDAVLYAVPCRSMAGKTDLWKRIPEREEGDERIRVGMVHGQTVDIPGFEANFPIAADAAQQRGLDYLAIGDTHAFREVVPSARYPVVYPSAPEPTKFGEEDAGYVAVVLFPRGRRRAIVRAERVSRWRWLDKSVHNLAELEQVAREDDLARTVLRVRLNMRIDPEAHEALEQILRTLGGSEVAHGRAGVLQVDRTGLDIDTGGLEATFEDLPEVLQAAARRLMAAQTGESNDPAKRALLHLYRLSKEVAGP